jgi:hypothetical protein
MLKVLGLAVVVFPDVTSLHPLRDGESQIGLLFCAACYKKLVLLMTESDVVLVVVVMMVVLLPNYYQIALGAYQLKAYRSSSFFSS